MSCSEEPESCGHPQTALMELDLTLCTLVLEQMPLVKLMMSFLTKVELNTLNKPGTSAKHC